MIFFSAVETTTEATTEAVTDNVTDSGIKIGNSIMTIDPQSAAEGVTQAIGNGIAIAITIGLSILLFAVARRVFKKYSPKIDNDIPKEKKTMMRIIYSILKFAIIVIAVIVILSCLGVNISGAIATLGIAGACGALAVQDLLKDMIQGVNIVSEKFYAIGDVIEYDGKLCRVLELTMRNTKLLALDDCATVYTVGNQYFTGVKKVPKDYMVDMEVFLPYDEDIDHAWETMEVICEKVDQLQKVDRCFFKGIQKYDESSINYLIRFYCLPEDSYDMKRQVNRIVQRELHKAGISIPFPQLDVHLDK